MGDIGALVREFGLGAGLAIIIAVFAWFLLKKTFENHKDERDLWVKMMDVHFKQQEEGHSHQRTEHEKLLEGLNEVNLSLKSLNGKH